MLTVWLCSATQTASVAPAHSAATATLTAHAFAQACLLPTLTAPVAAWPLWQTITRIQDESLSSLASTRTTLSTAGGSVLTATTSTRRKSSRAIDSASDGASPAGGSGGVGASESLAVMTLSPPG